MSEGATAPFFYGYTLHLDESSRGQGPYSLGVRDQWNVHEPVVSSRFGGGFPALWGIVLGYFLPRPGKAGL